MNPVAFGLMIASHVLLWAVIFYLWGRIDKLTKQLERAQQHAGEDRS